MTQKVEAITIDEPRGDHEAAIARLKAGSAGMRFFSEGPLPSPR